MLAVIASNLPKDLRQAHLLSLGIPGGIRGITPAAAQIAARSTHKDGGDTQQQALSLNRVEDLRDSHGYKGFGGRGSVEA